MPNTLNTKQAFMDQVEDILQSGSEEDKQILELALQAIKHKKEKKKLTYLSGLMDHSGRFIDDDTYEMVLPITPLIMNPLQIVHGGITATLADSTMGSVIIRKLPENKHAVTSEMKINYISPGVGQELVSRAKVVHMGSHLCVAECRITTDTGKLVAIATGTFFVIKAKSIE